MATFVNKVSNYDASTGGSIASPQISCTAGNTLLVCTSTYKDGQTLGATTGGMADTAGNSWTRLYTGGGSAAHCQEWWVAHSIGTHATNVVTLTFGFDSDYRQIAVLQYSGLSAANYIDELTAAITASGTSHDTTAFSTGVAEALMVAYFGNWSGDGSGTFTGDGDTTARVQDYVQFSVFDRVVSPAGSYSLETTSQNTCQKFTSGVVFDVGASDTPVSPSAGALTIAGYAPTLSRTGRKLKLLTQSTAASASGVAGAVFAAPSGSDITGAKIGEFTGKAFEASLEGGLAVLKVSADLFDAGATLGVGATPVALARNTLFTTGIISGEIIEE